MTDLQRIEEARRWLEEQRATVHPGPIETIRELLRIAESVARNDQEVQGG